jgi:recombinational DNA repair ATPase RecF
MSASSPADRGAARDPGEQIPEILQVEIRRFKTVAEASIPWSDGMALFGANAAGKTNVLEAIALMLGDDATVSRAERADWDADCELSAVLRVGAVVDVR